MNYSGQRVYYLPLETGVNGQVRLDFKSLSAVLQAFDFPLELFSILCNVTIYETKKCLGR